MSDDKQEVKVTFLDEYGQLYSVSLDDYHNLAWYEQQYVYWHDPECTKSKDGNHQYIETGFGTLVIKVCKHCKKEKNT